MRKSTLLALVACLLAGASFASAATIRFRTDEELIALSERVVRARATARRTVWGGPQGRTIYTVTTLEILEDFTGAAESHVEVWELGGVIGNEFMYVGGAVHYAPAQEVVVMLERGPHGLRSVAMNFSKFEVQRTSADDGVLRRNMADTFVVGGAAIQQERSLAEFRQLAREVLGRDSRRFRVAEQAQTLATAESPYSLLSFGCSPTAMAPRWPQADSGTAVRWFKNTTAPPPLTSGDAVPEIMTSLAAWTNPASASIILQYGGTANIANPRAPADGTGLITFEDPNAEISGSTLAIGGGSGFCGGGGTVNGTNFAQFTKGYVIFQNAADLSATFKSSLGFSRVLTHEIGHGIGLGHSDVGDSNIMYFSCCSANTPIPPNIGSDDLAGLNFIYPSNASCTYSISPTSASIPAAGGSGSVTVTTQAGCAWSATSTSAFVTVTSGSSGTGNGTVAYSVAQNTNTARSGGITIAGQTFTVNQAAACSYTLSPSSSASISAAGGTPSVTVTTQAGCAWSASNNSPSFITINSPGSTVTGSGTVSYSVAPNGVSFRSGTMTIANRTFTVNQLGTGPAMALSRSALVFGAATSGATFTAQTQPQTVRMTQSGAGSVTWTASSNRSWLTVSPTSGTGAATFTISVAAGAGVPSAGSITGAISVNLTGAGNASTASVAITLNTYLNGASSSPFGSFDSPANNATGIAGSLPVTGWALDDVQVDNVAIYRDAVSGESAGLKFIGHAVLVDGARPDLVTPYASVPLNNRGGWGYLMLSNMLPGRGNGTFVLHAYATDREGRQTLLGSKTITCANSGSAKPFGAIDTPAQGATISGTSYNNFGWVLAPDPGRADVPGGGSVTVFIDGAPAGTPTGWSSRPDISALFPESEYPGVNFAQAVYTFDASALGDGVHTISWTVIDNLGNGAGIGSRYFTVTSAGSGTVVASSSMLARSVADEVLAAPRDRTPIVGRRGYDLFAPYRTYVPDRSGTMTVYGEEIDRFELQLNAPAGGTELTGHLRVGNELRPLPIGSTLDGRTGLFTWQPGVGFIGAYDLVFVRWADGRAVSRQDVRIVLNVKGSGRVGPQVIIDVPAARHAGFASVTQPFVVAGWAADLDAWSGTGIATLHVWAYPARGGAPIFLGTTAYGGTRPDVGAVYSDQFTRSGYSLTVRNLPPGDYMLAVFGYSFVQGGFAPASTVWVNVR